MTRENMFMIRSDAVFSSIYFHLKLTEFMDAEPDLERTILCHFSKSTLDGISTVTGRVEALLQFLCFLLCPLYQEGYTSGEVRGAPD